MAGITQNYKFGLIYMEQQLGLSLIGESFQTRREWRKNKDKF